MWNLILDEIVKRKLLVDGDGGGDDKRLVLLQKYVVDWCNDTSDTDADRLELSRHISMNS